MVAWVAGQDDLVQAFREKRDVYSEFASEVYGRAITKADKTERFVGKTCVLGLGYGMGAEKFRRTLEIGQGGISVKIDINEAERIVRLYRQKNWKIVQFWQQCGNALRNMLSGVERELHPQITCTTKGIRLPNGFYIRYPALRETANGFEYISDARSFQKAQAGEQAAIPWTRIYGGKVTENCVQALAALVIREQMAAAGQHFKVAFQVHDEIIVAVPDKNVEAAEAKLIEVMSTPPKWASDLPVACESGAAKNYGDT
jgi:DNA polymerase